MGIGEKLRKRRESLMLSRKQLAEKIHVTPSAIANYENGISYPKPDILISLIQILEVDANYLYQDYLTHSKSRTFYGQELTPDEVESVLKYRDLTEDSKRLVQMIIAEEYERNRCEEWVEFPCVQPGVRKLRCGFLLSNSEQTIRLKKKHVLENMEFCFQIQVNSYEPVYKKHDILALKRKPAGHNEIGFLCLNGIYYIRTLCCNEEGKKLRALNVVEPDIMIQDTDDFTCLGTVLGQVYGTYEMNNPAI